jgi:hypothetical protein
MLFGYPMVATHNNWLHDCVCEAVVAIHAAIDGENEYPGWPNVLPEERRGVLRRRAGLRDRLSAYDVALRQLPKNQRDLILEALERQNRVADLLDGSLDCLMLEDLPEAVRTPVSNLFGFAFELLSDLGVRDEQYRVIYSATADHVCPFCGTECFDAPGAPREDLDHYLARKHYALAAANLRNLVPMGQKCNSRYKLANNLLRRGDGARRVAFDPYLHTTLSVSLDASDPFGGSTENTPNWDIQFVPDTPAVATWDEVFAVRDRYRRDHLDPDFSKWLRLFAMWVQRMALPTDTDGALVQALQRYEESWVEGGVHDRAFLKAAVFRMLRRHCESGHERLTEQLRSLAAPPPNVAEVAV